MTGTTYTERVGMAERTLEWYQGHADDLAKRGLNVSYWIQGLRAAIAAAITADAKQESLKAQLKASTEEVQATDAAMYTLSSGALDAAVGAYGKGSNDGEQVARIRSKLHRGPNAPAEQPMPVPRPSG